MRVRQLATTAVAVAVAAVGLTACTNKVGAAALVDNVRISANTVQTYVQPGAVPYQQTDQSSGQTVTVIPKVQALQDLVYVALFNDALAAHGGPATQAELTANAPAAADIATELAATLKRGYTARFAQLEVQATELQSVLAKRVNDDGSGAQLTKSLTAHVDLNPRYGTWDAKNFRILFGTTDGLPSFVTLTGATTTAPTG